MRKSYESMQPWESLEADRLRVELVEKTYRQDDALWWSSVKNPVPMGCFDDADLDAPAGQQAAIRKYNDAFFAAYRAARARRTPEQIAEERAEALAAHGPGVELVNVATGERWVTGR